MKLPNAEHAVVEMQKLVDYCLDPDHPRGKHKARVFLSSCGLTAEHADELRVALLNAAQNLDTELGEQDDYGQRYVIDLEVRGPAGTAQVRSAWIIRKGEDYPRFVSCYVL
ncbi:MAG: hypothetical protein J5I93_25925 [Pirellulaceae bacterium]|nr:hypothetical protein [Pirellulaceae bacterium]